MKLFILSGSSDSRRTKMASPLAMDLRTRVMDDVDAGMSVEQAAVKYSVTSRTIFSWKKLKRESDSVAPRQGKTGPALKLEPFREAIRAAVKENSGITLEKLRAHLKLPGCAATLWNALQRWGIVLKKSRQSRRTAAA
jgi:transposase